ncbi:pyridoxal-phosphate dependent enzyme, partial [Streptomyces sp. SID2131]|nr:pyridoxal-phosphate dependent enzyme [Streptomyces sp. SID2131]
REAADEPGTFYASHVHNPYFTQGTKTYVYELWEELGGRLPDTIVVPVGNGTLLLGAALALDELRRHGLADTRPALVAVQ